MIYSVIEHNLLNSAAKVEVIKTSPLVKKHQCVIWFIETKSDIQAQQKFRCKCEREPPEMSTIDQSFKSLWRLVVGLQK